MKSTINRLKGVIRNEPGAIADIETLETALDDAVGLLTNCKSQVGLVMGEQIEEFIGGLKGQRFCSKAFNYERLPDGQ